MKIRILSILLCLCMMLSFLTACAGERHDLLRSLDVGDRTFCVRGTGTRVKQIVVKQADTILWSSSVKVEKNVGTRGGSYGFDAVDLNFDGYTDISLAYDLKGECLFYRCWLYDAQSNTYVLSDELTGLANLQADAEKQCLFGFTNRITSTPAPSPDFSDITVITDAASILPVIEMSPWWTGSCVWATADAMGAEPRPASLENIPRETPRWRATKNVPIAPPPTAAGLNAPRTMSMHAPGSASTCPTMSTRQTAM